MQSCLLCFSEARCLNLSLCPVPLWAGTMGCNGSTRGSLNESQQQGTDGWGSREDVFVFLGTFFAMGVCIMCLFMCFSCRKRNKWSAKRSVPRPAAIRLVFCGQFPVYSRCDDVGFGVGGQYGHHLAFCRSVWRWHERPLFCLTPRFIHCGPNHSHNRGVGCQWVTKALLFTRAPLWDTCNLHLQSE